MALNLASNVAYLGDPARLPSADAPLPPGAAFYADFIDPVAVRPGSKQRLASNLGSLTAGAAVLRTQGGGFVQASSNSLDRFRWSDDGKENLGLALAHNLDRNSVRWDASALAVTAATVAAEAASGLNTWYRLTGDGTSAIHEVSLEQTSTTVLRAAVVEVARPDTNAAVYARLRFVGTSTYGIYDLSAGVCRGSGSSVAYMRQTARGWLLILIASGGSAGNMAALSLVGDYETAVADTAEALSTSLLFRGFKIQGAANSQVSASFSIGDWLPSGAAVSADAPYFALGTDAISRASPLTLLARLRTSPSEQQTLAGLATFGDVELRWSSSDTRLALISGSTIHGYIDQSYRPATQYHVYHRYVDGALTVGVAVGDVALISGFKRLSITRGLSAGASISYGFANAAYAFNGTLQKVVGWQASRSDADLIAFMKSLSY